MQKVLQNNTQLLRDRYVMHKHDWLKQIESQENDKTPRESVNNPLTAVEEEDMPNERLVRGGINIITHIRRSNVCKEV